MMTMSLWRYINFAEETYVADGGVPRPRKLGEWMKQVIISSLEYKKTNDL